MRNHLHLIVQANNGELSNLVRDFKKFTSKTILEKIQNDPESRREWTIERFKKATESHTRIKYYQFWHYGNHAEEIFTDPFLWSKLDYIHMNPVQSGIVTKAEAYIYSSASNYILAKGLVPIEIVEMPKINVLKSSSIEKYLRQ